MKIKISYNRFQRNNNFFVFKKIKMGTFLQSKIEFLNADDFVSGRDMKSNYMLPDGGYIFRKASDSGLEVILRINDITLPEYHTNNGITKLALKEVNSKKYAAPVHPLYPLILC